MARRRTTRRQAGKATSERVKSARMHERVERTRRSFTHPTNHWSSQQWKDLFAATRRKGLDLDLSLATPRGPVRLMAPRLEGHALCVVATADYRELMRHLA